MRHHANLLVGKREWVLSCIPKEDVKAGPDVRYYETERMSIDDARTLIQDTQLRPIEREYRTFIIITNSILVDAQNALLKLFEEPNKHTIFYFVVPHDDMLLPTVRSRLNHVATEQKEINEAVCTSFMKASYRERLEMVSKHLAEEDSLWVKDLVRGAERYASGTKNGDIIKNVLFVSSHIHDAGGSKKMLLEHLALTL